MMAVEMDPGSKFQSGQPKPLFDARLIGNNAWYDVSADRRFLLPLAVPVEAEHSSSAPMTVVINWTAGLKR